MCLLLWGKIRKSEDPQEAFFKIFSVRHALQQLHDIQRNKNYLELKKSTKANIFKLLVTDLYSFDIKVSLLKEVRKN